nr:MAG TPA: hypothetical protein [Caudoviricetes sp.]DAY13684.1 MAG TPA: hypothetical protein [Bacteriophage sp.]
MYIHNISKCTYKVNSFLIKNGTYRKIRSIKGLFFYKTWYKTNAVITASSIIFTINS